MRRKRRFQTIAGKGDPCPRCGQPTQMREHAGPVGRKQATETFYYSRWFYCVNPNCRAKTIMPDRYRVFSSETAKIAADDPLFRLPGAYVSRLPPANQLTDDEAER